MSSIKYWLWLSSADVSPKARRLVLSAFGGDPLTAFYAPDAELEAVEGLSPKDAAALERRDMDRAERILDECGRQNIEMLTLQDARYPNRLRNIYAPPVVIYVKGRLPAVDEEAAIAVIGTRKATPYGLKMGRNLGYQITKCGGLVVSGLTTGIDAAGAQGALRAGGAVVGVLGVPHEQERGPLAEDVASVGALISEYPPGTVPQNSFFRARNRIAAGLSVGVVVVEAPVKSGARLFAAEAAEQGREIFAVPGNADAENSAGSNAILKEGAKPVTDGWEILCEFAGLFPEKLREPGSGAMEAPPGTEEKTPASARPAGKVRENAPKKVIDKQNRSDYIDLQAQLKNLNEDQLKIISAMTAPNMHVDDIIEKTGMAPAKVLAELTMLQLRGYVTQESGKRFTLNIRTK